MKKSLAQWSTAARIGKIGPLGQAVPPPVAMGTKLKQENATVSTTPVSLLREDAFTKSA